MKGGEQPFFRLIILCTYCQHFAENTNNLEAFRYITLKKVFISGTKVKKNNTRKFKRKRLTNFQ